MSKTITSGASLAVQFKEMAEGRPLAEAAAVAHRLSGIQSEDGYEDYDSYYFQDDGSAARIHRETLEVDVAGQ